MKNMDETPLYCSMTTSTTVKTIGSSKVNIKNRTGKLKITVILTIPASEEKIAPLLIFKAKEGKNTERKLQQTECVNKLKKIWFLSRKDTE